MSERTEIVFNALAKELKDIEDEITAIKNKQFIGTDSIRLYRNLTPTGRAGGWDIDTTGTAIKNYAVVFTADNQIAPFCDVALEAYIDGVRVNPSSVLKINTAPAFFNSFVDDSFLSYANIAPTAGGGMGWYFATIPNPPGTPRHIQIRIQVDANDTGTIQVLNI
jgi:hypothetical protein